MTRTTIAWTQGDDGSEGRVWNPVRGCSRVSPGCGGAAGVGGCYAERIAGRFSGPGKPWDGFITIGKQGARWTGKVALIVDKLGEPLHWRKPCRVFVNSTSDLFHEKLSNEEIAAVFGVMAAAPQHTFIVLTKRAQLMLDWFRWLREVEPRPMPRDVVHHFARAQIPDAPALLRGMSRSGAWPLPNVIIGVSVEDQHRADERIPLLLDTPAAARAVSAEPLLGHVNLRSVPAHSGPIRVDALTGCWDVPHNADGHTRQEPRLSWVIAGGESGPGARPCDPAWLASLRDQCAAAGVPYFLKQLGGFPDKRSDAQAVLDGRRHVAFPEART